jgi:hypothetical protein
VAWVNRRIDLAREHACDEWALRHGKLTAGQYARCLLSVVRTAPTGGFSHHPACMATKPSAIERRIDVILELPNRSLNPRTRGLPRLALMLAWGGFVLAGAADATQPGAAETKVRPATAEAVRAHAAELYALVAKHDPADFDRDGVVSYREKDGYLVALAMRQGGAFMEEFPYADRNHSGNLDFLEAYGVIHGITRVAYLDRRIGAEIDSVPKPQSETGREQIRQIHLQHEPECMRLYHEALDAQKWLLDHQTAEPCSADLDNIWSVLVRTEGGPKAHHTRHLNHGGPEESRKKATRALDTSGPFHELEANIAMIESRLDAAADPKEIEKLNAMLEKLEAILDRLEAT